jgi:hypothetical protein
MRDNRCLIAALICLLCALLLSPARGQEIRPSVPLLIQSEKATPVAFLIYNERDEAVQATLTLAGKGASVQPETIPVQISPRGWEIVRVEVSLQEGVDRADITAAFPHTSARIAVARGIDLSLLNWRRSPTVYTAPPDPAISSVDVKDDLWRDLRVPSLWEDLGFTVCRIHVTVPESWIGRPVRLIMGAIDDNDIAYLNGMEIGRTTGWDRLRDYTLPDRLIRWGEDNVITVVVDNINAGGGIYKPPFFLLRGEEPLPVAASVTPKFPARPPSGRIGKPLPLRPMRVQQGVLRYPDGAEVALWGVNYYPQSWHQFENMRRLKVDMKAVMRQDFDHLQRMGVEAIRIHVFDREISDGRGNLVPNVHLDLLDYLVAECSRRGIYLYFTPIAWWSGPNEQKGAFSAETSKPGMMFSPTARAAATNYLKNFLNRVNPYTGRAYKDEPSLCLLEVMNEPAYFLYGDLLGRLYTPQGERADVLDRDYQLFREEWQRWLKEKGLEDTPAFFPLFRYEQMRRYIREMVAAIRSTGARQPVAISYFGVNGDDLTQAIADSECDAITVSAYPGGWARVNDGTNLLPQAAPLPLDARLSRKARLAYEFDTPATNVSAYLFPALAAHFRSGEVQVACQFQYDSVSTARWNTDWGAHWLNWLYTPSKTVSFMIGREAFHALPRGVGYAPPTDQLRLGTMATSFRHNQSLFVTSERVLHARSLRDWLPFRLPPAPRKIVGVGSSPYVEYGGTGLYVLEQTGPKTLRLTLNPDVRLIGNSLTGRMDSPAGELEENVHVFRLRLSGWQEAQCWRLERGRRIKVRRLPEGWLLRPGEYELLR